MRLTVLMLLAAAGVTGCTTGVVTGISDRQLPQMTDAAQHRELYSKVSHYVDEIAGLGPPRLRPRLEYRPYGTPTTWSANVCPQVLGLSDHDNAYVLARISQIARAAGVPLSCEHYGPNLRIFVTAAPKDLLKRLEKQNALDEEHPLSHLVRSDLVDQLIATPEAVRVWYTYAAPIKLDGWASGFWHVVEVIDQSQLQGVALDQLSDYVAMAGLTAIKPVSQVVSAPTILNVFVGGSQAAPAGLTDWDRAFLKSLYSGETWWWRMHRAGDICVMRNCAVDDLVSNIVGRIERG
jgi:hypothetical protein